MAVAVGLAAMATAVVELWEAALERDDREAEV
jgi:hypothetical protein